MVRGVPLVFSDLDVPTPWLEKGPRSELVGSFGEAWRMPL